MASNRPAENIIPTSLEEAQAWASLVWSALTWYEKRKIAPWDKEGKMAPLPQNVPTWGRDLSYEAQVGNRLASLRARLNSRSLTAHEYKIAGEPDSYYKPSEIIAALGHEAHGNKLHPNTIFDTYLPMTESPLFSYERAYNPTTKQTEGIYLTYAYDYKSKSYYYISSDKSTELKAHAINTLNTLAEKEVESTRLLKGIFSLFFNSPNPFMGAKLSPEYEKALSHLYRINRNDFQPQNFNLKNEAESFLETSQIACIKNPEYKIFFRPTIPTAIMNCLIDIRQNVDDFLEKFKKATGYDYPKNIADLIIQYEGVRIGFKNIENLAKQYPVPATPVALTPAPTPGISCWGRLFSCCRPDSSEDYQALSSTPESISMEPRKK